MNMNDYCADAQKALIESYKSSISNLSRHLEFNKKTLEGLQPKSEFYIEMQKIILENPQAMDAWKNFIFVCKLALDKKVKGINTP